MPKKCPQPTCGREIGPMQFCCSLHWSHMPDHLRIQVTQTHHDLRDGFITLSDAARAEDSVKAALNWPAECGDPERRMSRHLCRRCATPVTTARMGGGGGRDNFVELVEKKRSDPGPEFVIVGFLVFPNVPKLKGSYTPFVEHQCQRPEDETGVPFLISQQCATPTPSA